VLLAAVAELIEEGASQRGFIEPCGFIAPRGSKWHCSLERGQWPGNGRGIVGGGR
jgi:hypothetical protein